MEHCNQPDFYRARVHLSDPARHKHVSRRTPHVKYFTMPNTAVGSDRQLLSSLTQEPRLFAPRNMPASSKRMSGRVKHHSAPSLPMAAISSLRRSSYWTSVRTQPA